MMHARRADIRAATHDAVLLAPEQHQLTVTVDFSEGVTVPSLITADRSCGALTPTTRVVVEAGGVDTKAVNWARVKRHQAEQ